MGDQKQKLLSTLPSVDELLKAPEGITWLSRYQRRIVVQSIRDCLASQRKDILSGITSDIERAALVRDITAVITNRSSFSLRPVINATGIVLHTNLGRSVLSEKVLRNVTAVSRGYSNLEYDLAEGKRGKRHTHTSRLIREITGAEDSLVVNNNAAAVLLCLSALAKGKEVIVSRGELVEIGGSFRIPDVMSASGAALKEVGTTNKTHLRDYVNAVTDQTALLLKVHQSNYRITGFTEDVGIAELAALGKRLQLPVMYDLGSGCLADLRRFGIHSEPSVTEIVKTGIDIVTFSGDKLLGGPQAGFIAGSRLYIEQIRKNPLARALRIDKMTIAAVEATLMEYLDEDAVLEKNPVLQMLTQSADTIRKRAAKLSSSLKKAVKGQTFQVIHDISRAGGGSLPEVDFPTYAVVIKPEGLSVNELEKRLRTGTPAIIGRIKDENLLLDARTIKDDEITLISSALASYLKS